MNKMDRKIHLIHAHPKMEYGLKISIGHVIVDRDAFERALNIEEENKAMKEGFRETRTIYDTYEMNSEDMLFEIKKIAERFLDEDT